MDNRNLGGGSGTLDGLFATKYLLQSETLGAYHSFLVSKGAFRTSDVPSTLDGDGHNSAPKMKEEDIADPLYNSLLESITLGYTRVACSLLDLGVDPNVRGSGSLGKISDRVQQRILLKSNPLHLACARGDPHLVKKLLCAGASICFTFFLSDFCRNDNKLFNNTHLQVAKQIHPMLVGLFQFIWHVHGLKTNLMIPKKTLDGNNHVHLLINFVNDLIRILISTLFIIFFSLTQTRMCQAASQNGLDTNFNTRWK